MGAGRRRRLVAVPVLLLVTWVVGGCSDDGGGASSAVVASSSVIGDIVTQVIGDCAEVEVLAPTGADMHAFEPSARQAAALREAGLVVANGLGLEAGLDPVLDAAISDGVEVLRIAPEVDPIPFGAGGADGELDPHVWMDPSRMARAAELIGDAAVEHVGCDDATIGRRVDSYVAELEALDESVHELVATVPEARRLLVTNHDSMGYFAERYGFEILGVVIPGGSTLAEPGPAAIADLAATIREAGVPAIFAETSYSTALADSLTSEVGTDVEVVELYTESLGEPGSGADSYTGMIATDAERIVTALGGGGQG